MQVAEVRKALVALATLMSEALVLGLVPEPYAKYVMLALATLGAYGIYRVPNADPLPTEEFVQDLPEPLDDVE